MEQEFFTAPFVRKRALAFTSTGCTYTLIEMWAKNIISSTLPSSVRASCLHFGRYKNQLTIFASAAATVRLPGQNGEFLENILELPIRIASMR